MNTVISVLPNLAASWARFCTRDPIAAPVNIVELAAGLELLKGPHGAEWLARGYAETLKAVRNTGAENILAAGNWEFVEAVQS